MGKIYFFLTFPIAIVAIFYMTYLAFSLVFGIIEHI